MNGSAEAMKAERTGLFMDVIGNKIPKRVPLNIGLSYEVIAEYGGVDVHASQWNQDLVADAADRICGEVFSDICPFSGSLRFPEFYQLLQSQSFQMSSSGFMQHPEVIGMEPEDYDYLIEKPYDCLIERVLPRQYKALDFKDPMAVAIALTKSLLAFNAENAQTGAIKAKLTAKYGYYGGEVLGGGFSEAPFDFLADQLRSFRGISMDVRRFPDKVKAACDALFPIVFTRGIPAYPGGSVFLPLHMPTFMREKDFAELYWPSFKRMIDGYAAMGYRSRLFCEHDWMRYLDYLYELPTDTMLMFEFGDPKAVKEKLGKKHIVMGMYPVMSLKTKTAAECSDEAKRYLDALAPGGKYIFGFDKTPLMFGDIKMENLKAVVETVRDYGAYTNAGQAAGDVFRKEDYAATTFDIAPSKYFKYWPEYKADNPGVSDFAQPKLQAVETQVFKYLMYLLL